MKKRSEIMRLADRANQRFVGVFQAMARLGRGLSRKKRSRPALDKGAALEIPLDPKVYAELTAKVERILARGAGRGRPGSYRRRGDMQAAIGDPELKQKLRDLFDDDAGRRATAVRWIRRQGLDQALPALEAVLSVEASDEVRLEIARTIEELGARPEI